MAGSASTITNEYNLHETRPSPVRRIKVAWTSDDTTGAVSATTKERVVGTLLSAVTVPSATVAPTANYDITIKDEFAIDVLSNLGGTGGTAPTLANRHTSNTEKVLLVPENSLTDPVGHMRAVVNSPLTFAVTNAGNSKAGIIYLFYAPAAL